MEIKVYLDKEKTKEVFDTVEFEQVIAGEITTRKLYVFNVTDYYLNIELGLEGEYIKISKTIEQIAPKQTAEVEFEFTPKITIMQPITAQLKIKLNYVIR